MDDFNWPLLAKLLVIAILIPAWLPVIKDLYKEVNESLADEGGLFGRAPTAEEAKKIERKRRFKRESLVSVPLGQGKQDARANRSNKGADKQNSAPSNAPKRRGF
jgi:hypothetical protein